jgi:hypothetical protein
MGGFVEHTFIDKILICIDCREEFVFTASAQEYFAGKGYTEDPKRCKSCYMELKRAKRRDEREPFERSRHETELPEEAFSMSDGNDSDGNSEDDPIPR